MRRILAVFILQFAALYCTVSSDRLPFVGLPSIIRWDADNDIYVTPLRQPRPLVDIAVEISAELNGAKYSAFSNLFRNLPSDKTSKLTALVKQESPSGSYNIRVRVTGHEDFTATIGNGPNVRRIHVQTDKVFYAPAERVNVRLLPLTYEGTIYNGKIDLTLIDPNGFRIHNKTVQAGDRFASTSFELPEYLQFGDWKVVAKAVGSPREKFDALIRVQEYVMPKYRVLLSIEPSHESVFTLMTTVYARFAQGLPVSGDISIRCSLASQRDNATLNGHTVAPTQKKLTSETLKNGVWYGFVDVTRCVEGQLDAPPKIKLIAEVHEQGTFQPGVASVEWDFLQPGFQIIPTRPAFTSDTPKIYLYVNPISSVHSITDGAVNVVAHCVSDDKQVNGMNRSFSNQRIGVFFELDVDPRCILYKIRARRALTPSLFSRDELLVIPRTNVDFLKFSTIVPADSLSYIYEEDDTFEARISGSEVNYLVLCESRDFVASGWSSRKKIEFRITSNMNGQCILFTYTSDVSKFNTDMWLFYVPGHSCPDEFSLLLSSANITVAGKVTMALRGLPNSLATVQAIDSRLEGLISQSLETPKAHLWNFGIFASPDKSLDRFSWLSKLVDSAKFLANVGETCRQAAQHSSECPSAFQSSASLVSDLCLAEVVQNCPRNRGNGLLLEEARGGALRAPPAQVHVSGYFWQATKPKVNKQATTPNYLNEMLANMQNDDTFYSTQPVERVTLRDFFPEVWLFEDYKLGIPGRLDIGLEAPHSVTQWTFNGHFWSPGRTGTCRVPAQAVVSLRHVFMEVDLPLHVYENETVQVRITVTADNISHRKRMAVCFKGLSPVVCGDVGPDGELGETDYTRVVLSPQQPVVVKNFYIKFLQTGMHNLSFELREESNFPGGDWHCRDSSVEVFDRIKRQVKVDQRVDVEEHFRQVIIYRQKRIIRPEGGAAALAMRRTLSPEIIDYTQSYPDDDTIITGIKVNTAEKMYNFAMEFSKYVPSFPPGLSSEIISSKGRRNRRNKRDLSFGQSSYSLANVLKELSYATYELKSLKTFRSTVAQSELDDRETNIGNLLSELLTFSNCTSSKSSCAFGEFTRPSTYGSQPNLLLTSLATSVLCQQRASEEYVCGPLDFLAQHIEASSIASDDYSAYVNFDKRADKDMFLRSVLASMARDCMHYSCAQTQQKAWSKLYESFYAVSDSVHMDLRTEAALAYSSTAVTRGLMRHRLASRAKSDRLPYWSMERESNDILDSNLIRSGNILSNSLALLAFTANETVYAFWRAHFDFDTLSAWLVEEQTSSRQFENAIDTFFGCKALFQYQLRQTPTAVYESLVANISSAAFSDIRFDNTQMPFSMSIPTDTKTVTLTTKGDGRMLVGVRVLTERRKRSRRTGGAGGGYPVTIEMQQSRDAASGMIRQTVTLTPHSVMLKTLEVEHGVFTGFTTEPHLVQILDNATHFLVEPRISSTAVHFVLTNLMHNHGAKYVVVVKEPTTSYSPENLAPVAIIAKYNVILGQLIVSPSTLDFGTIALMSIRRKREAAISRYQLMRADAGAREGGQPAHNNDQADLVDTVCLPNGACTCAEITCAMRCSNCSMLTFEALCEELQDKQHFGAIFRINGKNTTTVNHATYDVYDARIIDWYGKGDAPTQLSIWLRTCNSQCLRMVNGDANGNGKPRYLLIGNAEGIFDGSRMSPAPAETNTLSTELLRKHYVMRDNDRLARSTDCWNLFGRFQDEQC